MEAITDRHYTFDDLWDFRDDGRRREIIDGVLYVSPQARLRHQEVVGILTARIRAWVDEHGGKIYPGANVDFRKDVHLEPDVVFVGPEQASKAKGLGLTFPPDLVVEVSSPSTRSYDLGVKRHALRRHRVPEFWFVDLDADEILVHRLVGIAYAEPEVLRRGDVLTSPLLPGLRLDVDDVLGEPERAEDS